MDVSVIIVNYNTFQLTYNCIQSIQNFTSGITYEIILVDNNSSEDFSLIEKDFKDVIVIKNNSNQGFAAANNIGIRIARGKQILLLNSDTELLNNAIKIAFDQIDAKSTIGALSVKLEYPDTTVQFVGGKFPSILNNLIILFRIDKLLSKKYKEDLFLGYHFDHLSEKKVDWIWGAFFMIRKKTIEEHFPNKKLHDTFFMYGEDKQWCYHIKKAGFDILYNPSGKVLHYFGGSDKTTKNYKIKYHNVLLKNEQFLWQEERGRLWTFGYFFSKALIHFSMRTKVETQEGIVWFKYSMKCFGL